MNQSLDLQEELTRAACVAEGALSAVQSHRDLFVSALKQFAERVDVAQIEQPNPDCQVRAVEEVVFSFATKFGDLRTKLIALVEGTRESLMSAYADLERDSRFVTVVLFGRTRAGKSTTMEALTRGNGASIGQGRQHTTTKVKAYYFPSMIGSEPPPGPCMRIVDTPGIEGFNGSALAEKAEEFIERADHVLFLLSDDKAGSGELDHLAQIRTLGKGVTVLLNVKATDEDLDLLVHSPYLVFREDEIAGHVRRIEGYIRRNFQMSKPPVIPFHARAAWLARSVANLGDETPSHKELETASRITEVENRLRGFVLSEAIPARLSAPRDLLISHLVNIREKLRSCRDTLKEHTQKLRDSEDSINDVVGRAVRQVSLRLQQLRGRFEAASEGVSGIVDEVIATRGSGRMLDRLWAELLASHGVVDGLDWFVREGEHDFQSELTEQVRVVGLGFNPTGAGDLDELLSRYHEIEKNASRNKYARAGLRAGAGAGTAALALWAVTNLWNPTGWAAAAALAASAAAGAVAEKAAREATNAWERSTKKEMLSRRSEIVSELRKRLWADHSSTRKRCTDWTEATKTAYLSVVSATLQPACRAANEFCGAVSDALERLESIASEIDRDYVEDILRFSAPEVRDGEVHVERVARNPGFATKILLSAGSDHKSPLPRSFGPYGRRVRQIRACLSGERVNIVDANAPPELRVVRALGLLNLSPEDVSISTGSAIQVAVVRISGKDARRGSGPNGQNARLAQQLLGFEIQFGEEECLSHT